MTVREKQLRSDRPLAAGDEAGTAPEDRPFRPDVQGLRAVAVLLVVLFHSGITSGGFVGVDVFFVISGFVITGVLLRERASSGRTSLLAFYGRRCRRIIPAATLVIIVTVGLAYWFLGVAGGMSTATDGRWAAVFLANLHFSVIGTNYFTAQRPPSPLLNYWSLSVEEQFYVVYPTFFLLLARAKVFSLRARLAIGLTAVIGVSLAYSVIGTQRSATAAYFSTFTRAWELALGALVAVGAPWLKKVPTHIAAVATWLGFGAILVAATTLSSQSAYPGSLVAIPVLGSAFIVAGGTRAPSLGVEALFRHKPFQWFGKLSYSLYLWHWPILIIAAEYAGRTSLSVKDNLAWDVVALIASVITYRLVENPVRHAKRLLHSKWASIGLGVGLVALTLVTITVQSEVAGSSATSFGIAALSVPTQGGSDETLQEVEGLVAASSKIKAVPSNLHPSFPEVVRDRVQDGGFPPTRCFPPPPSYSVSACTFGDPVGSFTMVLYGDSHAAQWFADLDNIARRAKWRLIVFTWESCPADPLPVQPVGGGGAWTTCDQWHHFAISYINKIDPDLLIISQSSFYKKPYGTWYTPGQWQRGLEQLLSGIRTSKTVKVVIGDTPDTFGSECMVQHPNAVQHCSILRLDDRAPYRAGEKAAAIASGSRYIDVIPWFCTKVCSPIIGRDDVYIVGPHITRDYSLTLQHVLAQSLDLPSVERSEGRH